MSITTTYTCDKCGASQGTYTQMWEIKVAFYHYGNRPEYSDGLQPKALWCRKCVEPYPFLLGRPRLEGDTSPPPPTLEDFLRDIIREEVTAMTGAT